METKFYRMSEVSELLATSRHSINNLCNGGLIPHVKRDKFRRRIFNQEQVDLIAILLKMRAAGFTSTELRQYSRLYRQGEATAPERLEMLTTRKHQLWQEIKERQAAIDFIERQEELAREKDAPTPANSGERNRSHD